MRKKWMAAVLLCGIACLLCGCDSADYKRANELLEAGNFAEARAIYTELKDKPDYAEDCAGKLLECDCGEAEAACGAGDFETAQRLYEALAEEEAYQDAAREGFTKVAYGRGRQLMEEGDYLSAAESLAAAGDYLESRALIADCAAALLEDPQVGDPVIFGSYTPEDGGGEGGPIQWRVLARNGDDLLLLSEYVLDEVEFSPYEAGSNSFYWNTCEIRTWLNGTFYKTAFTGEEQARIQEMVTSNLTTDKVFFLSRDEVEALLPADEDRIAVYKGDPEGERGNPDWWIRYYNTRDTGIAGCVDREGEFYVVPNSLFGKGLRPAICIRLSGEPEEEAQSMALFGCDFDVTLRERRPKRPVYQEEPAPSGPRPCPACNGSGTTRYYYGSSDLEAILSGHDPYILDTCPMCGGSGMVS